MMEIAALMVKVWKGQADTQNGAGKVFFLFLRINVK